MYSTPTLATRFARNTFVVRSETPLADDQMRRAAPSIFAEGKHGSRSERYTYIPTIEVLRGLRKEGFEPFMVAQSKSRIEGKTEFTKHMIRMRHAGQVTARPEANEIILINSHDGASSYQMLAGALRLCTAGHSLKSTPDKCRQTVEDWPLAAPGWSIAIDPEVPVVVHRSGRLVWRRSPKEAQLFIKRDDGRAVSPETRVVS
jgi:hypothetical protein